jgi:hypothetical protein
MVSNGFFWFLDVAERCWSPMLQNSTAQSSLLYGESGLPVISIPMVLVFSGYWSGRYRWSLVAYAK